MKTIKSIIQLNWDKCFFPNCTNRPTQIHHVMHGPNRKKAEEDGLLIHVCPMCHEAIHFSKDSSRKLDRNLKRLAQIKWEEGWKARHTMGIFKSVREVEDYVAIQEDKARQAWLDRYGRNYLE